MATAFPGLDPLFFASPMRAALNGTRPATTPVWFMRQAGRSLPEYRQARGNTTMLEACTNPELAAEITLQPVRRHNVDAAVFFSDIVVPLYLAGVGIDIVPGIGPLLDQPITTAADVNRLTELEVSDWEVIETAATLVRRDLPYEKVLLGFAGAPFTLASYLIETSEPGASKAQRRTCRRTREFIATEPAAWSRLATWCAKLSGQFMKAQINGGAEAVQLFDSWAGSLTVEEYRRFALPYTSIAFQGASGATHVHFGVGTAHLLEAMGEVAEVISISDDVSLSEAASRLPGKVLQGNLNPGLLVAGGTREDTPSEPTEGEREQEKAAASHTVEAAWREARRVLEEGLQAPAHIFNLGHGVKPQTDPGVLTELTARVHDWRPSTTRPDENETPAKTQPSETIEGKNNG